MTKVWVPIDLPEGWEVGRVVAVDRGGRRHDDATMALIPIGRVVRDDMPGSRPSDRAIALHAAALGFATDGRRVEDQWVEDRAERFLAWMNDAGAERPEGCPVRSRSWPGCDCPGERR
jgi:hypothetical protein